MARGQANGVMQWLRTLVAAERGDRPPDRELVRRFVTEHDEAAFTLLLQKHGPMVMGVCRRMLANDPDAEDAFQATFLVFARKAASIRRRQSLSCWLYGVASRVAGNVRRKNARLHPQGPVRAEWAEPAAAVVTWREVRVALDDEIARLTESLRLPVILCYLDGKTRDEAAAELGCNPTTLRGRLERGRELLRARLTRRGITLSAALLGSMLAQNARASLTTLLIDSTAKAALAIAVGKPLGGLVSTRIIGFALGELHAMFMHKLMYAVVIVSAVTLILGGVAGGTGALWRETPDGAAAVQIQPDVAQKRAEEPVGLAVADERDDFAQGLVGESAGLYDEQLKAGITQLFILDKAKGKELPKGGKILVVIREKAKLERLVGKEHKEFNPEEGLTFGSLIAIERDKVESFKKKEADTWWIEPKAILILKYKLELGPTVLGAALLKPAVDDDELRKLLIERHNAAFREMKWIAGEVRVGKIQAERSDAIGAAKRYTEARLDLTEDAAERVAVRKRYLEYTEIFEKDMGIRHAAGRVSPQDFEKAVQAWLEAQILLLKEQRRAK